MKSKQVKLKNREPQGFGMGAKGVSLQGGMVEGWLNGEKHTHYIDVTCGQSSNQTVEEAMKGAWAQVAEAVKSIFKDSKHMIMNSDKRHNFNSFEQVPWIVEGNRRGWGFGKEGPIVVLWTFSESQSGKGRLDCFRTQGCVSCGGPTSQKRISPT
jgi:hypothetical protein